MSDPTSETVTLEQSDRITATPETVWSFWTEPQRLAQWWGDSAEVEPRAGGRYRIVMGDGPVMVGRFVELDRPRRLVFSFGWEHNPAGQPLAPESTRVEVTLHADGSDTVVTLRHIDMPVTHAPNHEEGWAYFVGQRLPSAVDAR